LFVDKFEEGALALEGRRYGREETADKIKCQGDIDRKTRESIGANLAERKKDRTGEEDVLDIATDVTVGAIGGEGFLVEEQSREAKSLPQPDPRTNADNRTGVSGEVGGSLPAWLNRQGPRR